jgi:hypothetical protein
MPQDMAARGSADDAASVAAIDLQFGPSAAV